MKPRATLPTQRHCISVKPMPQRPKNLKIARVEVHPAQDTKVRVGPAAAVPARFTADVQLEIPDVIVSVAVSVAPGGQPAVTRLTVWPGPKVPLTSGTLRQVLIDPILQAAMAAAAVTVDQDRSDVAPGAFHVEGEPEHQLWVSTPTGANDRVQQIARLYNDAVTAGSRSPGLAAAEAVHISRAQASRYIKRARDIGLIPPVGEAAAPVPPKASANGAASERPDPGPSIFRDPEGPRPWENGQ